MSAERFPQMDEPLVRGIDHYSPEHLRYKNGGVPFAGDMAAPAGHRGDCCDRRDCLQAMGKKALGVMALMRKPSKPAQSSDVGAIPIFRQPPDLQKLGRAVLGLVEHLANEEHLSTEETEKSKEPNGPVKKTPVERRNDHAA